MQPDPEWSSGTAGTAPGEGLHEAFARQAQARPDAVVLIEADRTITYAALDARADAWAAGLAAAGVVPGDLVPVLLPRGTDLVVALLATLKAGAAYCLLPPDWPADRLRAALDDLRPPLMVVGPGRTAPADCGVPVWSTSTAPTAAPPDFRPAGRAATDPCCVFFTSGTTGRPKGVLSPHVATSRLFRTGGFARFDEETVMPLAAATAWDAFSLELWGVLLHGGTSVIVTDPYLSAGALADGVARHGADTVWSTAGLFNLIVDEAPEAFRGVRQVMIGGERLSVPHVRRFLRRHPQIVLLNGYGPVESTVFATTHRITEADCDRPTGIPLGRPVPGTQVYVLDGTRPCAPGETGEICLAGDGLALEYLGDPALTAAKFTPVTLDGRRIRVYRTGDLGRQDADGLLHLLGRADRQVKIRGHRIEPAEVERQIERLLPEVRHCRVVARTVADRSERELVAFCVPVRDGDPLSGAMPVLGDSLVAYQRPVAVLSVDAFPLTAQGKLDERALLAMTSPAAGVDRPGPPGGVDPASVHDPVLRMVAERFAAVLGVTRVPLDVPFPHLGMTSLDAGRVCAQVSARTAGPIPVSWLYEHPTAAGLADRVRRADPRAAESEAPADPDALPLSAVQMMQLTREMFDPADRTGHCLLSWVIEGDLDRAALMTAVAAVHRRHEPLRAAYQLDPEPAAYPELVPAPPVSELAPADSVADALDAARHHLGELLSPQDGDVWRVVLVPAGPTDTGSPVTVLGVVVHHVAFDGWSEGILADDLGTAYRAAVETPAATPERFAAVLGPVSSMAELDRAARVRRRLAEPDRHLDRLRAELAGLPALRWPPVPVPGPVPMAGPPEPPRIEVRLAPETVAAIDVSAAEAGVTRFVVLLALWAASVAEVTGQRDFAVGTPVAQRDGTGLDRAVGCHITMLCLRLRGAALDGGGAAIRQTGQIVAQALAARETALSDLLDAAGPGPVGRAPLYQTLFAYQDNAPPRLRLPGARTTFVRQPYLDIPLELHAELWPDDEGGLRVEIAYRPEAVAEDTARDLAKLFDDYAHSRIAQVQP
ncbi:amino acid adenylation domain-containing protein [Micromonosporaceae bacterium Da 78-11]